MGYDHRVNCPPPLSSHVRLQKTVGRDHPAVQAQHTGEVSQVQKAVAGDHEAVVCDNKAVVCHHAAAHAQHGRSGKVHRVKVSHC